MIQRVQRSPLLLDGKKCEFKFTVLVKSIVPLQAYVLRKADLKHAKADFTIAAAKFGDEAVHSCTEHTLQTFEEVVGSRHDMVHARAVD